MIEVNHVFNVVRARLLEAVRDVRTQFPEVTDLACRVGQDPGDNKRVYVQVSEHATGTPLKTVWFG